MSEKEEETRSYWKRFGNHERAKHNAITTSAFMFRHYAQKKIFLKTFLPQNRLFFEFRQENVSKK